MQKMKKISLVGLFFIISAVCFAQVFFNTPSKQGTNPSGESTNTRNISQQDFQNLVEKMGQTATNELKQASQNQFGPILSAPLPSPPPIQQKGKGETPMQTSPVNNSYSSSTNGQTSTTTSVGKPATPLPPSQVTTQPQTTTPPNTNTTNQPYTGFGGTNSPTTPAAQPKQQPGFNIQY